MRPIDGSPGAFGLASLGDRGDDYRILNFFQFGCPGCRFYGFALLLKLIAEVAGNVGCFWMQTVFENGQINAIERICDDRRRYA